MFFKIYINQRILDFYRFLAEILENLLKKMKIACGNSTLAGFLPVNNCEVKA